MWLPSFAFPHHTPKHVRKLALDSAVGVNNLAIDILKVVRPDLISSYVLTHALRKTRKSAKRVTIPLSRIEANDQVFHNELPGYVVVISKIVTDLFSDTLGLDLLSFVNDLSKDVDYEHELAIWSAMTSAMISFQNEYNLNAEDKSERKEAAQLLLLFASGCLQSKELIDAARSNAFFTEKQIMYLLKRYSIDRDLYIEYFGIKF